MMIFDALIELNFEPFQFSLTNKSNQTKNFKLTQGKQGTSSKMAVQQKDTFDNKYS